MKILAAGGHDGDDGALGAADAAIGTDFGGRCVAQERCGLEKASEGRIGEDGVSGGEGDGEEVGVGVDVCELEAAEIDGVRRG